MLKRKPKTPLTPYARRRRRMRRAMALLSLVVILLLLLPTILTSSGQLQRLVEQRLAKAGLNASVATIKIGWLTPLRLSDLQLEGPRSAWQATVPSVVGNARLFQLLTSSNLGSFVVQSPVITLRSTELQRPLVHETVQETDRHRDWNASISELSLQLQPDDTRVPMSIAEGVNLGLEWQVTDQGRILSLRSGRVLDQQQLTSELCHLGMKYVVPVLSNVSWARGSVSLDLATCQIALDAPDQTVVRGSLILHSVEAGLHPHAANVFEQIAGLVRETNLKDAIKVVDESSVEFKVEDRAVYHEGFEFGLQELNEELSIRTEGRVDFDQQLDLVASVPIPFGLPGAGQLAKAIDSDRLKFPIRGTLSKPKLDFDRDEMLRYVKQFLIGENSELDVEAISNILRGAGEQIRQRRQMNRSNRPPRFRRLRQLRNGR